MLQRVAGAGGHDAPDDQRCHVIDVIDIIDVHELVELHLVEFYRFRPDRRHHGQGQHRGPSPGTSRPASRRDAHPDRHQ
jgi:hypothetical protein